MFKVGFEKIARTKHSLSKKLLSKTIKNMMPKATPELKQYLGRFAKPGREGNPKSVSSGIFAYKNIYGKDFSSKVLDRIRTLSKKKSG